MNLYEQQKQRVEQNLRKSYETLELLKERVEFLEKGKKANIGETREWKGNKYQKTAGGWVKLKEKPKVRKEEFVDEDTGEVVEVEIEEKEKQRTDSPSKERKDRKEEKRDRKESKNNLKQTFAAKDKEEELNDLLQERKQLLIDMEQEAGDSDKIGNEYGEKLNRLDILIERRKRALNNLSKAEAFEILGL